MRRRIAAQRAGTSSTSRFSIAGASTPVTTPTTAASAYVQPTPVTSPARTCTTTTVVASQSSVPSDSGAGVGIW